MTLSWQMDHSHRVTRGLCAPSLCKNLGTVHAQMGHTSDAVRCLEEGLALLQSPRSACHPADHEEDKGVILYNLAVELRKQNKHARALRLLTEALELYTAISGPDSAHTGDVLDQLSQVSSTLGDFPKAAEYGRRCERVFRKAHGADHPLLGSVLHNLGAILCHLGEANEAYPYGREALDISIRVHGSDHEKTGDRMQNLAVIVARLGRHDQAHKLAARAAAVYTNLWGKLHIKTSMSADEPAALEV